VDAGWLLAAAALEVVGARGRDGMACRHRGLLGALAGHVATHSGGTPLLRTYWYDGAPGGAPSHVHDRIAALPYVKVRLGRLNRSGQQKGVDVLIYHDLLTLAHERAIGRAYLVAGDEDLREGVVQAQKLGIQVVLLGMPVSRGQNQSARLVRDCDEYLVLPREVWEPFCAARTEDDDEPAHEDVLAIREVGRAFARDWVAGGDRDQVGAVLACFPDLPSELDIALVHAAEERLGSMRGRPDLKTELRGTFWFAAKEARGNSAGRGPRTH
jgi:NYN domain-containing protein